MKFILTACMLMSTYIACFSQGRTEEIDFTIFLIGDTGEPETEHDDPVFSQLKKRIDRANKNAAIVFLGDNVYHNGLPPESNGKTERAKAEKKLLVQLDAIEDFKGEIYFIPGNHDWNDAGNDGISYVQAQEEFIEFYLDRGDVMIPDHGCPGPETKKLGDNTLLIAMDSQWWLHPHPDDDLHYSDCRNKNKLQIIQELKEILDKNDDKFILLVFHHPIYSDGSHNGFFTLKDHFFPLVGLNKSLWLPLPVLGSLYPFYRSAFGDRQDMPHPLYSEFRDEILQALYGYENIMIASGHEHNLQYFQKNNHHFIKSGSGSKTSPLPLKTDALFNSEKKGYAQIDILTNGQINLRYFTIDREGEQTAYEKTLVEQPKALPGHHEDYDLEQSEVFTEASTDYATSSFHQMLFGKLYRKDWATPSTFRTINLSKELGGLRPVKAGGGMTSNSLRLIDHEEREFVLRSVQKDVSKVVPSGFRQTIVEQIFQDQIAASQPYAALTVPPLAKAARIYHTEPEIVFLPKQPALGEFNRTFGDELYLFEARPAGDREDDDSFGNSQKIVSFSKMLERIHKNPKHHVHQEQVLRSRLFDIYLGDWDRHDDQWRWASFEETHTHNGKEEQLTFYEPIPRDRDQVFFRYKGVIPWISKLLSPQLRKFITFGPDLKKVKYLGFNARHFDRSFLNEMDKDEWIQTAREMKTLITDEVIEESINRLPPEIETIRGDFYRASLKSRRDQLEAYAEEYYDFLSDYVDVVGTDKKEHFLVSRLPDKSTLVTVIASSTKDTLYRRIFPGGETKEIRLYGLDGDDAFILEGSHSNGPLVRVIGGEGEDRIEDTSQLKGLKKSLIYYDSMEGNEVNLGRDAGDRRSTDFRENLYDRKEFYYNSPVGLVILGFNPDDGLAVGFHQSIKTYGFRKKPYKHKHAFGGRYGTASQEFSLNYHFSAVDILHDTDFALDTRLSLPTEVNNFFGLSPLLRFDLEDFPEFRFFRYKQAEFYIRTSLQWLSADEVQQLNIGPFYHYTDLLENAGRLVSDPILSGIGPESFTPLHYTGIDVSYRFEKVDNPLFPTIGMSFSLNPSVHFALNEPGSNFTSLEGSIKLYNYLWVPRPFILVTSLQGGINWGDYPFFHAHYAGRTTGLRGFRENRLGGDSSLIWSNDLRLKLGKSNNRSLPFTMGLIGSFDYGRVWLEGQQGAWYNSYGGGIWINIFDVMPLSFYYMTSGAGENNFIFTLGFTI